MALYRRTTAYFSIRPTEKRWIWTAFTGSFATMEVEDRYQSLKDDSLSELVAATSWSSALVAAPSGTGASGWLSSAVKEMLSVKFLKSCTDNPHECRHFFFFFYIKHSLEQVGIQTLQDHFIPYCHNWNSLWRIKHIQIQDALIFFFFKSISRY